MEFWDTFQPLESYDLWMVVVGLGLLGAAVLPRMLSEAPLSLPIVLLALGWLAVALPLGLEAPDPLDQGEITERLTELGVIVALMAAGLRIDRAPGLRAWASTWRLLGITMILTIVLAALVGWAVAAFVPATAMLLGAVISPTDPVLASEVQVGGARKGAESAETEDADPTTHGEEDEVRFALTSEAGLNDGLVFPFTYMAISMAAAGARPGDWIVNWILVDVCLKIGIALLVGWSVGKIFSRLLLALPAKTPSAKSMVGLGALAATLAIYGATELAGGYGFIATFVGAVTIRNHQRRHEYHEYLFSLAEKAERLLMAAILIALGAAVAGGLLDPLTWPLVLSALLIVFVVRPLSGVAGLIGFTRAPWRERLTIAFYGVRGIGSLYYLAFALNEETFGGAEELWALVALVIVISVLIHGLTAGPLTQKLDEMREARA